MMKPQPILENVSLKPFNTFHIDVKAKQFLRLKNFDDVQIALDSNTKQKLILGGGSNVLFAKDYSGLVIKNEISGIEILDEDSEHIWIKVGAGENWHTFVLYCVQHAYGGIENLSLIPGTVGAAPMQNIGAYGVEICSVLESLDAIELASGNLQTFEKSVCEFSYRSSIFKHSHKDRFLITHATLRLNKKPIFNTQYGDIQKTLEKMGARPSIKTISDAVIYIRKSKLPDPNKIPNAGSFFKNPIVTENEFNTLQAAYPDLPSFSAPDHQVKIPAAWLIEQCGWKGKTYGAAGVHDRQALVLVNHSNANGEDLKKLAMKIQKSVLEQFAILLTPEVNIID